MNLMKQIKKEFLNSSILILLWTKQNFKNLLMESYKNRALTYIRFPMNYYMEDNMVLGGDVEH